MERPDVRAEKAQADGAGEFGNSIILFPDEKAHADGAGESGNRIIREKAAGSPRHCVRLSAVVFM